MVEWQQAAKQCAAELVPCVKFVGKSDPYYILNLPMRRKLAAVPVELLARAGEPPTVLHFTQPGEQSDRTGTSTGAQVWPAASVLLRSARITASSTPLLPRRPTALPRSSEFQRFAGVPA